VADAAVEAAAAALHELLVAAPAPVPLPAFPDKEVPGGSPTAARPNSADAAPTSTDDLVAKRLALASMQAESLARRRMQETRQRADAEAAHRSVLAAKEQEQRAARVEPESASAPERPTAQEQRTLSSSSSSSSSGSSDEDDALMRAARGGEDATEQQVVPPPAGGLSNGQGTTTSCWPPTAPFPPLPPGVQEAPRRRVPLPPPPVAGFGEEGPTAGTLAPTPGKVVVELAMGAKRQRLLLDATLTLAGLFAEHGPSLATDGEVALCIADCLSVETSARWAGQAHAEVSRPILRVAVPVHNGEGT